MSATSDNNAPIRPFMLSQLIHNALDVFGGRNEKHFVVLRNNGFAFWHDGSVASKDGRDARISFGKQRADGF